MSESRNIWTNPCRFAERADLVSRMTLEEKASQMVYTAPPSRGWSIPPTGGTKRCTARRPRRHGHVPAGHRHSRHVHTEYGGAHRLPSSPKNRAKYNEYSARTTTATSIRDDLLVPEHQHFPRSALGPRSRNLRRGSLPDGDARRALCQGLTGRRPEVSQGVRLRQAFCRAFRPGIPAPRI